MDTEVRREPRAIARKRWLQIVSDCASSDLDLPLRRTHDRFSVAIGNANLLFEGTPKHITGVISLLQVSAEGLTIKTTEPIPPRRPVHIEGIVGEERFVLSGKVVHSTQTVGGYKTGIRLQFPEEG